MLRRLLLLSFAMCMLPLLVACDAKINVKGQAYGQLRPTFESQGFVDDTHPDITNLKPLDGVKITLFHFDDRKRLIDTSTPIIGATKTDSNGSFEVGGMTAPLKFEVALVVEKEGFKPLTKIFMHDKIDHQAIIILSPINRANDPKQ